VAEKQPLPVAEVASQKVEVGEVAGDRVRADAIGAAASPLLPTEHLRHGRQRLGDRLEVVPQAGAAVAERDRDRAGGAGTRSSMSPIAITRSGADEAGEKPLRQPVAFIHVSHPCRAAGHTTRTPKTEET
jgi:hypothetical protein